MIDTTEKTVAGGSLPPYMKISKTGERKTVMTEWAKREIEIACKRERGDKPESEWDYGCACYDSAYKAFQSLLGDGHSGMSIQFTKQILNRLIDGKPLTPIEDTPDAWGDGDCRDGKVTYQCRRMSALFKDVYADGKVEYHDVDRCLCVPRDNPGGYGWHNGFISKLIHEKYPITMPYYPAAKPMVVYCTEGLSDPANGDFDTIGIWYVVMPDGKKGVIERFFKESADGWAEIDEQEYYARVGSAKEQTDNGEE